MKFVSSLPFDSTPTVKTGIPDFITSSTIFVNAFAPVVWIDTLDWPLMEFLDCIWLDEEFPGKSGNARVQQAALMAERCAEKRMGHRQIRRKLQYVTAQLRGFVEAPGVHDNRR